MNNRAAIMYGTHDVRVEERAVPEPGPGEVLVEIGAVGVTEQEARQRNLDVRIGTYPLKRNAKASVLKDRRGFVKIIAEAGSGKIVGLHILGPQATELIQRHVALGLRRPEGMHAGLTPRVAAIGNLDVKLLR